MIWLTPNPSLNYLSEEERSAFVKVHNLPRRVDQLVRYPNAVLDTDLLASLFLGPHELLSLQVAHLLARHQENDTCSAWYMLQHHPPR